jgi:hypothetical protein
MEDNEDIDDFEVYVLDECEASEVQDNKYVQKLVTTVTFPYCNDLVLEGPFTAGKKRKHFSNYSFLAVCGTASFAGRIRSYRKKANRRFHSRN